MRRFWLAPALAVLPFLTASPVGAATLSGGERTPVAAAMTTVGPHRMAVIAVGHDILGVIVDDRMYARSFRQDVRELDVTLLPRPGAQPVDYFTLNFGGGTAYWSVSMVTPRSGTGIFAALANGAGQG